MTLLREIAYFAALGGAMLGSAWVLIRQWRDWTERP